MYEQSARKFPYSALADDALFRAAVVYNELLKDQKKAIVHLEHIARRYSRADHAIGNGETCRWTAEDSELQLSSLPTNKQILVTVKLVSKDVVDAYAQAAS